MSELRIYKDSDPGKPEKTLHSYESMRDALVRLLADGRTRFCVVGAGHLVGERGIPALLARDGWRVTGPGFPVPAR